MADDVETRLENLEAAVAALQAKIDNMATKLTLKQANLLMESSIGDLTTKVTNLESRVLILEQG